jgi:CBS domain containing-hemolysin-like protein
VDDQDELCGVVSITDVAQASVEGDMDLTVADIATTSLITAYPDQVLHDALRQWGAQDVSRILVIDRENPRQLLGVLRRRDIVAAYGKASRQWSDEQTRHRLARLTSDDETRLTEIVVSGGSSLIGQLIKDIRLPKECILVSITRGGNIIIPHGDTKLHKGDRITVFCASKAEAEVRKALTASQARNGPPP